MTQTIHKFTFTFQPEVEILLELPTHAKVVHVATVSPNVGAMWVLLHPTHRRWVRRFRVVGTGRDWPNDAHHVGTVIDGDFVWHIAEIQNVSHEDN